MKRVLCILAAVVMVAALLSACGSKTVTATVQPEYVDDFAKSYASDIKTADDGSVTYEFTADQYEQYLKDFRIEIRDQFAPSIDTPREYSYVTEDGMGVVVGVFPDDFDEEQARADAAEIGKIALKYNMNLENPTGKITVTYENASTAEDYFTIEVSTED